MPSCHQFPNCCGAFNITNFPYQHTTFPPASVLPKEVANRVGEYLINKLEDHYGCSFTNVILNFRQYELLGELFKVLGFEVVCENAGYHSTMNYLLVNKSPACSPFVNVRKEYRKNLLKALREYVNGL